MLTTSERQRVLEAIRQGGGDTAEVERLLERAEQAAQLDYGASLAIVRGAMKNTRGDPEMEFDRGTIHQLACQLTGEQPLTYVRPTNWLDVPIPPAIAPGGASAAQRVEFNAFGCGRLVGIIGEVLDAATGFPVLPGAANFQLRLNADYTLNQNGNVPTFTSMGALLRSSMPYWPFERIVSSLDFMDVLYTSAVAAGGISILPSLTFAFCAMPRRPV